ncbi:hypothetical protein GDO86_007382 [Hymenochirus boettgeri]|uniref:Uncharacterized protein n=1 Tax=Hymenochirus boettgeri TaxID=247094 RepID=A0A8T2IXH7_9PIPI|nr:hypothetical protein GDO86_007382 [Hymenochirus boettgeri]
MDLFNVIGSFFQVPEARAQNVSIYYSPKESFKGQTLKRKLSKSDIGSPSNFKHITHVGWDSGTNVDTWSDGDLKRLFNLAGIKEEHLRDKEISRKIFAVIEKKGGMEAVRKESHRMKLVETPSPRYRLRSWSSTGLTPSKTSNSPAINSSKAPKIPLAKLPPSFSSYYSVKGVPATPPSCCLRSVNPLTSPSPVLKYSTPVLSSTQENRDSDSIISTIKKKKDGMKHPPLPPRPPTLSANCSTVVPLPPLSKSAPKLSFKGSSFCQCQFPASCQHHNLELNGPPLPPPLPPFFNKASNGSMGCLHSVSCPADVPSNVQLKEMSQNETVDEEVKEQHKDPSLFLEQIKRGIQLKTVSQTKKKPHNPNATIVSALMDVIQKRHKALHSSDDEAEDDEWED